MTVKMKNGIRERTEFIRNLADAYTRSVSEFCEHDFLDDSGTRATSRPLAGPKRGFRR